MTRSNLLAALLGVAALTLISSARADIVRDLRIAPLRGLDTVRVTLLPLDRDVENDGLSADLVRQDVELRLRKVGIRVLSEEEFKEKPLTPTISVKLLIAAHKGPAAGLCTFSLSLDLCELVTLARDSKITALASTWHTSSLGAVGKGKVRELRSEVTDAVDDFLNDFLAANPKK